MGKYNYKISYRELGQKDWTQIECATLPFKLQLTLDETLDSGKLKLVNTRRKEVIKPFTAIKYEMTCTFPIDNGSMKIPGDTIYMLVMRDMVAQTTCYNFDGTITAPIRYDHTLEVIEPTKLLERHICDTMTFTNRVAHHFGEIDMLAQCIVSGKPIGITGYNASFNVYNRVGDKIQIPSLKDAISLRGGKSYWSYPSGIKIYNGGEEIAVNGSGDGIEIVARCGEITIEYYGVYEDEVALTLRLDSAKYILTAINDNPASPPWSITRVINRILEAGVTRREGIDKQAFTLDPKLTDKYSKIAAPEFHITRSSLFEALLQVGSFIHAIPRLKWNSDTDMPDIVTFDELGGSEEYKIPDYCSPLFNVAAHDINEYSGHLDSIAENVINTANPLEGSVVSGWKTMRAQEGEVIISNDSACILTEFPIYRVLKVEMGYVNADKEVGDITPFVYEASEYATLAAHNTDYPYSLQYALKYTQGGNTITGFGYVPPKKIGVGTTVINAILIKLGFTGASGHCSQYAFRVTYIPIMSGRFKQYKPYSEGYPMELGLISNQSANTVESGYYGENLKGQIARIGEEVRKVGYRFKRVNTLPKLGQIFDGYYISGLEYEFNPQYITCYMELAPYFNRLSNYIGLNSSFRMYDISEKQSVDRNMNYSQVIEIGDINASAAIGINCLYRDFIYDTLMSTKNNYVIDKVQIEVDNVAPQYYYLPCTSLSVGNSVALTFQFKDNYGVGYGCNVLPDELDKNNNAIEALKNRNVQKLVRAGNEFGEFNKMSISFLNDQDTSNWDDQTNIEYLFNSQPEHQGMLYWHAELFNLKNIIVQKDGRERIIFTYQIHFAANRKSIVIGRELTTNNALVKKLSEDKTVQEDNKEDKTVQVVFLPYKLNQLKAKLVIDSTCHVMDLNEDLIERDRKSADKEIIIKGTIIHAIANPTDNKYRSWALFNPKTNEYFIGENIEIAKKKDGGKTREIVFNF